MSVYNKQWKQLNQVETQAAKNLGYNAKSWAGEAPAPVAATKNWSHLNRAERTSAGILGYNERSWNNSSNVVAPKKVQKKKADPVANANRRRAASRGATAETYYTSDSFSSSDRRSASRRSSRRASPAPAKKAAKKPAAKKTKKAAPRRQGPIDATRGRVRSSSVASDSYYYGESDSYYYSGSRTAPRRAADAKNVLKKPAAKKPAAKKTAAKKTAPRRQGPIDATRGRVRSSSVATEDSYYYY